MIAGLPIRRASELKDAPPTTWVVHPYVACGAITEISGPAKKAGKSTLLFHMVKAVLDGKPFLGEQTIKGPVLYLSEEGNATLKPALDRAGLLRKDLYTLQWHDTWGRSWGALIPAVKTAARELGIKLVIVDTFPQFAPGCEVDADAGLAALRPLRMLTKEGMAVVVVRHDRKAGGSIGQASRGTSSIGGGVDILCHLRRRSGRGTSNVRVLDAIGRFQEIPESVLIELTDDGYKRVEKADVELSASKRTILTNLNGAPKSLQTLIEESKLSRAAAQRAILSLLDGGAITRAGRGSRTDPYTYIKAGAKVSGRKPVDDKRVKAEV